MNALLRIESTWEVYHRKVLSNEKRKEETQKFQTPAVIILDEESIGRYYWNELYKFYPVICK